MPLPVEEEHVVRKTRQCTLETPPKRLGLPEDTEEKQMENTWGQSYILGKNFSR